jgi:DNA-nicking Smr family endonuclease
MSKSKKKSKPKSKRSPAPESAFVHQPFRETLGAQAESLRRQERETAVKAAQKKTREATRSLRVDEAREVSNAVNDWERALGDVMPMDAPNKYRTPRGALENLRPIVTSDEAAMKELIEWVCGEGEFCAEDSDEYMECWRRDVDSLLVRQLRLGKFAIQGHVDLHGLNAEQAREVVAQFVRDSFLADKRCVLVVHGRGLHSPDGVSVIKNSLHQWLTEGDTGRYVLAYTSAQPKDGGAGATYVLLQNRKGKKFYK